MRISKFELFLAYLLLTHFSNYAQDLPPVFFKAPETINAISRAFIEGEGEALHAFLDDSFEYRGLSGQAGIRALDSAISHNTTVVGVTSSKLYSTDPEHSWTAELTVSVADSLIKGYCRLTTEAFITTIDLEGPRYKPKITKGLPDVKYHEIDFLIPGHIFVKTTIGGVEGYFMIDNGTPGGSLDAPGIKALGLNKSEIQKQQNRVYADIPLNGTKFPLEFDLFQYEVNDHGYSEGTIFGVIGTNLLSAYNVTFDYIHNKLILSNLDEEVDLEFTRPFKSETIAIQFGPQGHTFFKESSINDIYGLIHFDTGIYEDKLDFTKELAKKANVKSDRLDVRIAKLQINDLTWQVGRNYQEVHGNNVLAEFGNLVFSNSVVTIYPLKESAKISTDVRIPRGGKLGLRFSYSNMSIDMVQPDSYAHSLGIRKGDKILGLNGTDSETAIELGHKLNSWEPDQIKSVQIRRKKKVLSLTPL